MPATNESPTFRVPRCTITVPTMPRPMSTRDSSTMPVARVFGLAFRSSISDCSRMLSSSSLIPVFFRAETRLYSVVPPHSSGFRPCSESCFFTSSRFASGRSILLTATMIGTFASLAWLMASTVWGITPSTADTTSTTMSVTWAPRARILVNASWPGVSMKTMRPREVSTL